MHRLRTLAVPVFLCLQWLPTTAAATNQDTAMEHYQSGMAHYHASEFEQALADFAIAYREDPDPSLLFNIAQSHWKLGQYEEAIEYYRRYLVENPDTHNRAKIEVRIETLKIQINERSQSTSPSTERERIAGGRNARSTHQFLAVGSATLGVGALVVGGALGIVALKNDADARADCFGPNDTLCPPDAATKREDAATLGNAAIAALVAGGVLGGVASLLLLTMDDQDAEHVARLRPMPAGSDFGLSLQLKL